MARTPWAWSAVFLLLVLCMPVTATDTEGPAACDATLAGYPLVDHEHTYSSGASAWFIQCDYASPSTGNLRIQVFYHPETTPDSLYCTNAGKETNAGDQVFTKYHESLKIYATWRGNSRALSATEEAAARASAFRMMTDLESVAGPSCEGSTASAAKPVTLAFNGYAVVPDDRGDWLELPGALVRVLLTWGPEKRVVEGNTGPDGQYLIQATLPDGLPDDLRYRVQLELQDERLVEVRLVAGGSEHVVSATTAIRTFAEDEVRDAVYTNFILDGQTVQFVTPRFLEDGTLTTGPADTPELVRDAALAFAYGQRAAAYGTTALAVAYDHELPVTWRIHQEGGVEGGAHYDPLEANINLDRTTASVAKPGGWFVHYHEFGHHLHFDSALSRDNSLPSRGAQNLPHAGYYNADSVDSFIEGFADFYAAAVAGSSRITISGTVVDLEANAFATPGFDRIEEELQVAALLWDLTDGTDEANDTVQAPIRTLWGHLVAPPLGVVDVRSMYLALEGKMGTAVDAGGVSALDRLFILHGFYWDQDGNGAWDQGEPAGHADSTRHRIPGSARAPRPMPPPDVPGIGLALDPQGARPSSYQVRLLHDDPSYDYAYVVPAADVLRLFVPPGATRAEIVALAPGYAASPIVVNRTAYVTQVASAQAAGADVFAAEDLALEPSDLDPPGRLKAKATGQRTVELTWRPVKGADTVVVAGLGAPPADPTQGRLVHRGSGSSITDTAALGDAPTFYAAFSVAGDDVSTAATVTATAPAMEASSGGRGTPAGGLAFAVSALAVAACIAALSGRRPR